MNAHRKTCFVAGITAALGLTIACGSSTQQAPPPVGKGQLVVHLVDAPNPDVKEIWVNVTSVRAHAAGTGWVTISDPAAMPVKIDLLKLQNASMQLGLANLPPGTVTQLRLLVAAEGNEILVAGSPDLIPLKVPSGFQSGIKIHGPWQIAACNRSSVTIDFDGKKSIQTHPTGSGEEWILRPVIRVRASSQDDVGCGGDTGGTGGELPPVLVPAGGACTESPECFSGSCVQNFCAGGANGAPCHASTDCLSNVCGEDATCAAPPDAAGAGASCVDDSGCLSNACVGGVCDPGDQGAVCKSETDCRAGLLSCNQGSCEPLAAL